MRVKRGASVSVHGHVAGDAQPSASEQADVRSKLARSECDERHAFVLVPGFTTAPFEVADLLMRDDAPLPTAPPRLPTEITHVWIASTWTSGHGVRWSPDGWESFDKGLGDHARQRVGISACTRSGTVSARRVTCNHPRSHPCL